MVGEKDLKVLIWEKLSPSMYREIPQEMICEENLKDVFGKLAKNFAISVGEKGMDAYMVQGQAKADQDRFVSRIVATIKTHKPPGEVSVRLIHSGVGHPWATAQGALSKFSWKN